MKEDPFSRSLQHSILLQSQRFLLQLQAGTADELLISLLLKIRKDEAELTNRQHLKLHPRMWNILLTRFINRRAIEIIDTLN